MKSADIRLMTADIPILWYPVCLRFLKAQIHRMEALLFCSISCPMTFRQRIIDFFMNETAVSDIDSTIRAIVNEELSHWASNARTLEEPPR